MRFKQRYKQLTLDAFKSSLDDLDKSNRWVWLGDHLPWEEYEKLYESKLNNRSVGAGNKPARMVIDLCGLSEFTDQPIFDPSLFVDLRKRISEDDIIQMTQALLRREQSMKEEAGNKKSCEDRRDEEPPSAETEEDEDGASFRDSQGREHKGVLIIDATCANAEVRYPVDVDIINDGCRKTDCFIRRICKKAGIPVPTTNYAKARNAYTYLVKMKKKGGKLVKETIGQMLSCLHKDILTLMDLTAGVFRSRLEYLRKDQRRVLDAIMKMFFQQQQMHETGAHRCDDRIISIFQPHLRSIVRGKASANVEFGSKIGAAIVDGYTFIDHHSWEAYNESADMELHIGEYLKRFGYLPATILADKIYMNRGNRALLKGLEIKSNSKPLGRLRNPQAPKGSQQKPGPREREIVSNARSVQVRGYISPTT